MSRVLKTRAGPHCEPAVKLVTDWARLQVTGKLSSTSTELTQVRKRAELADRLQGELQEAQEALIERDGELQDLHQDVDQVGRL